MRQVDVSAHLDAPREAVHEELSPEAIVEYEGTYDVVESRDTGDGWLVTVASHDEEIEMDLAFEELPNGYAYELLGDGPFEELYTAVTVHGGSGQGGRDGEEAEIPDGQVRVTMRSEFTFGGWFSPVVDWLAAGTRENELKRALLTLGEELGELDRSSPDDATMDVESDS